MEIGAPEKPSLELLSVKDVKVNPESVDEWYGLEIEFEWQTPLTLEQATAVESDDGLMSALVASLVSSPEYEEFFSFPQEVSVEEPQDGSYSKASIPKLDAVGFMRYLNSPSIGMDGGEVLALMRGGEGR